MNQGYPSPGVGLAAPNDPRLTSRLAQPHNNNVSYINNKPPQLTTTTRLAPASSNSSPSNITGTQSAAAAAAAAANNPVSSPSILSTAAAASASATKISSSQGGKGSAVRLRFAPPTPIFLTTSFYASKNTKTYSSIPKQNSAILTATTAAAAASAAPTTTTTTTTPTKTNSHENAPKNKTPYTTINQSDNSEVVIIGQVIGSQGGASNNNSNSNNIISDSQSFSANRDSITTTATTMRRGPHLKIKSRPKKNQTFDVDTDSPVRITPIASQPIANGQQQQQPRQQQQQQHQASKPTVTLSQPLTVEKKDQVEIINPLTKSNNILPPTSASSPSQSPVINQRIQKQDTQSPGAYHRPIIISGSSQPRASPLSNVVRHLPAFQSSSASKQTSPPKIPPQAAAVATTITTTNVKPQASQAAPSIATATTTTTTSSTSTPKSASASASAPSLASPSSFSTPTIIRVPATCLASSFTGSPKIEKAGSKAQVKRQEETPRANRTLPTNGTPYTNIGPSTAKTPPSNGTPSTNGTPPINGTRPTNGTTHPVAERLSPVKPSAGQQRASPTLVEPKRNPNPTITAFSWILYLDHMPAPIAPKEAFRQDTQILNNQFKVGMKLAARDPRNSSTWCLATVHMIEGPRLRLRFEGGDSMNDFFELINSENIRPVNSEPEMLLLPPMAFKGSLSSYPKFVEKILMRSDTVVAPPEIFVPPPRKPERNLFKQGMKLEAIDKKNPYLICPATVGEVNGDDVKILFDGWKGSFDYVCKYHSRDIFPVNWCRDNCHYIAAPNGWESLLGDSPPKLGKHVTSRLDRLSVSNSPKVPTAKPTPPTRTPSKETHLAKVQLLPKSTSVASSPSPRQQGRPNSPLKSQQTTKPSPSTPKTRDSKRKRSASPELEPEQIDELSKQAKLHQNDGGDSDRGEDEQDDVEMDNDHVLGDKFQCQRTVPYDEWVKVHRLAETQVASAPSTSGPSAKCATKPDDQLASNNSTTTEGPISSVAGSDTASVASTSTIIDAPTTQPPVAESPPRRGRPPKKIRLDAEVDRMHVAMPPGPYTAWTVEQVLNVIRLDDTLEKYATIFENHEIDGKAFGLLTTDVMIKHMSLKIGPVLKIAELIQKVKQLRMFDQR